MAAATLFVARKHTSPMMESAVPNCIDAAENFAATADAEKSVYAEERVKQDTSEVTYPELKGATAKSDVGSTATSGGNQTSGKADMGEMSKMSSSCVEVLQKLLMQNSVNNAKRLVISAQSLTQTRTTTTTTTSTLPPAAKEAAQTKLVAPGAAADTRARGGALVQQQQQQCDVTTQGGLWKNIHSESLPLSAERPCQEIARFTPKPSIVDLPLDLMYTVPKVKTRMVKYTLELPSGGVSRLVPTSFPVDTPFIVPQVSDVEVPVVMSQTYIPELEECSKVIEIPAARYVPKLVPVDVYVPRPVAIPIKAGEFKQYSKPAQVSEQLLHQLSVEMNPHLVALNQYNTQQAEKFSHVVKRSVELANTLGVPPPVPERIEIDPRTDKINCTEVVNERGFRELTLNLEGKDVNAIDTEFSRIKAKADATRETGPVAAPVTEDYILSVVDSGYFHRAPSGYARTTLLSLSQQEMQGGANMLCMDENAVPENTGDQTVAGSPRQEEGTTAVARPETASPVSD